MKLSNVYNEFITIINFLSTRTGISDKTLADLTKVASKLNTIEFKELLLFTNIKGYKGPANLSLLIDFIRKKYNYNIWIEHGIKKKHDVTTNDGCHRGSHTSYEEAQLRGIEIFFNKK